MPKLILSVDDNVIDEYTINKDTITIGRRTDNDICLDNLAISGYHSQITTVLNDSFLEDLNSTNGTFVNSKLVKKHALRDGDIIDIGNHRIKYINHLATSSANSEFEKTVVMPPTSSQNNIDNSIAEVVNWIDAIADAHSAPSDDSNDEDKGEDKVAKDNTTDENNVDEKISTDNNTETADPIEAEDKHNQPHPAKSSQNDSLLIHSVSSTHKLGRIQILSGSNSGKELVLDKSLTTIGKPNVAVVGITKRSSGYFIIHVEGSEDTASKLNGEVIEGKAQPLEDHDIIDVAGIKLEFFVE